MAWPDLSDLRTETRIMVSEISETRKLSDTVLNRFINDAQREIAIEGLCIEDQIAAVTTASSRLVSLSTNYAVKRVEYVPDETSEETVTLQKIGINQLGRMAYMGDFPQYYTVWGSYVLIDPISTLVYNVILHVAKPPSAELANNTDEPQIPKSMIQAINPGAAYRYYIRFRQWASMQASYNEMVNIVGATKNMYLDKQDEPTSAMIAPDAIELGGR